MIVPTQEGLCIYVDINHPVRTGAWTKLCAGDEGETTIVPTQEGWYIGRYHPVHTAAWAKFCAGDKGK